MVCLFGYILTGMRDSAKLRESTRNAVNAAEELSIYKRIVDDTDWLNSTELKVRGSNQIKDKGILRKLVDEKVVEEKAKIGLATSTPVDSDSKSNITKSQQVTGSGTNVKLI